MFPLRSFRFPTAPPVRYSGVMDVPAFLRFAPVPVRARRDGWTPVLQRRFILNLARGMPAAEAARSVGRSRQTAYALRDKPGAEEFAAAWDAAVEFARSIRATPAAPALDSGIETFWVPRYYRGRLIGFVQREDTRGAMRRLAVLDRVAERLGPPDSSAPDFETLLEIIESGRRSKTVETDPMRVRTRQDRQFPGPPRAARVAGR